MNESSRINKIQTDQLPADILELEAAIGRLPPEQQQRIEPVFMRVLESSRRRRRILGLVQDALAQLRLDTKYLLFDLEATRREREIYRRKAEET